MRLKTAIISGSVTLFLLCTTAYASRITFSDVTEQTPYYTAIDKLYDMGVIQGYEDGTFRPNEKISVAEGITLAEKLFGDTSVLPNKWEDWFSGKWGWKNHINLSTYPFRGDYGAVMTYETASEMLLKLNHLPVINSSMWDTRVKSGGSSDYTNTMYVRGYEERISFCGITRAEFCNMLTFMLNYDGTYTIPTVNEPIIEPEIYGDNKDVDYRNAVLNAQSEMICVPEFIRRHFVENGYKLMLVPNEQWTALFDNAYAGMCSYRDKTIYIRIGSYSIVPHEFGHYLHGVLQEGCGYDITTDDDFKKQLSELKFEGDNYFMTNDREFFAEAFEEYCHNSKRLKERCPDVYTYTDDAVILFSVLSESDNNAQGVRITEHERGGTSIGIDNRTASETGA